MNSIIDDFASIGARLSEIEKKPIATKHQDQPRGAELAKTIAESWMYSTSMEYDTAPSEYTYPMCFPRYIAPDTDAA